MKKRKKDSNLNLIEDPRKRQERVLDMLGMMKHKDLVIACVSRGLPPEEVVKLDHNGLGSFFLNNYDNSENPELLVEYDIWVEKELKLRGYKDGDALLSPCLKLGYVGKGDLSDVPKKIIEPGVETKKIPDEAKEKVKREKDETTGVVVGTKKNLTYTLAQSGMELSEAITQVKQQFPDAQEKSIKIWFKRALKEAND